MNEVPTTPIEAFTGNREKPLLSTRTVTLLQHHGIHTMEELAEIQPSSLTQIEGVGRHRYTEIVLARRYWRIAHAPTRPPHPDEEPA